MNPLNQQLGNVKKASRSLVNLPVDKVNQVLIDVADELWNQRNNLLTENQKDCARMDKTDPKYPRLELTESKIESICRDMKQVAALESPIGQVLEQRTLKNGLELKKVSVPIGVIGIIYEARPNVTADVFALCFKSGNACILKGGSDAEASNQAIVKIIHHVLQMHQIDPNSVHLLGAGREGAQALMTAIETVDVIIPRGSQNLINYVREHAKVPVIETGAGIVHVYVDASADIDKAEPIVWNSKVRNPAVCNALDTLVVHQDKLADLPKILSRCANDHVEVFADEASYKALVGHYPQELLKPATPEHYGTEFLSLKLSVKTVVSLEEAISHITEYSSKHSEAIVAEDQTVIETFLNRIDAAAVYANASTGFTDGAQFGLGAEIGISTQKLHARGPMGLKELTSYKYIVAGSGQIRE